MRSRPSVAEYDVGEVLWHVREEYLMHVIDRWRDVDGEGVLYRLSDRSHTTSAYWREEDVDATFIRTGVSVDSGLKPIQAIDGDFRPPSWKLAAVDDEADWFRARKRPVEVDVRGPLDERERIETREGVVTAEEGDYVIRGVEGEVYPIDADVFAQTYDVVEGGEDGD